MDPKGRFQPLYKKILIFFPVAYFLTRAVQEGMGIDPWWPYFVFLVGILGWYFLQRKIKWCEYRNDYFVESVAFLAVLHTGILWGANNGGKFFEMYFMIFFNGAFLCGLVFHRVRNLIVFFSYVSVLTLAILSYIKRFDLMLGLAGTIIGMAIVQVAMLSNRIKMFKDLIDAMDEKEDLQTELDTMKKYKDIVFNNAHEKYLLLNEDYVILMASSGIFGANQQVRNWCIGKNVAEFLSEKSNLPVEDRAKILLILTSDIAIGKSVSHKNFTIRKVKNGGDIEYFLIHEK